MLQYSPQDRPPHCESYIPNRVVRLSAASRNWVVSIALSLAASTGTSLKDFLTVSKKVDMVTVMYAVIVVY